MRVLIAALLAVAVAMSPVKAEERKSFSQAELDQMLAPIALYPDALLSQVLMAATYPLEVVEAARWSRAHSGLQGDEAVRAAADKEWDASVKSLLAFPQLLSRMDEKLEWTRQLGDAFLAQEPQVMDTVQDLRRRARIAGQLAPDERVRVVEDGRTIVIEPANPRVVYVPYYDPWVVYGPWWWPAYPPVVWAPWPGYVAYRPGFWWGVGVGISTGFFFGSVSWPHRHVVVTHVNNYYVRPPVVRREVIVHRPIEPGRWQHDPAHRRGIVYRSPEVQQRYAVSPPRERRQEPARGAPPAPERRAEPPRGAQPSPERRQERPEVQPDPARSPGGWRSAPQREERERRDDRRGHAMPPAFHASPPARIEPRHATRTESLRERPRPQLREEARSRTRMEPPRAQPRVEAPRELPRFEAPRGQPRMEPPRATPRMESRGGDARGWGGSGELRGGGGGGIRQQAPAQRGAGHGYGRG